MDYLEHKAVVTAVEIQREINVNYRDTEFLERQLDRLRDERRKLTMQLHTLKDNYKECKV